VLVAMADQVVAGYDQLDSKFHALLAQPVYDVSRLKADANQGCVKQKHLYTAGRQWQHLGGRSS